MQNHTQSCLKLSVMIPLIQFKDALYITETGFLLGM